MKKKYWILLGLILVALVVLSVLKSKKGGKGQKVEVEKIKKRTILETVAASGKIFPEVEISVSSDVSGEIIELYIEEGDSVVLGQLLAKINPDTYKSAVTRSEASLNNAKAQHLNAMAGVEQQKARIDNAKSALRQIEIQLENVKLEYEKSKKLFEEGIISDTEYKKSEVSLKSSLANFEAVKSTLSVNQAALKSTIQSQKAASFSIKGAEATLTEMQSNLRRTKIFAPMSGIVSRLNVEKGERVVDTAQMAGTELLRVADMRVMEVQVNVNENDILAVKNNQKVAIEVDAHPNKKFVGTVIEIANSSSSNSKGMLTTDQVTNFIVKITIDPDSYKNEKLKFPFKPGMSANVEIETNKKEDVLCVPIQCITIRDNEADNNEIDEVIFIAKEDTVAKVIVTSGIQDDDYIELLSGVQEGENVVKAPYSAIAKRLKSGDKIVIKETDKD